MAEGAPGARAGPRPRPRIFGRLALGLLAVEVATGVAVAAFYSPGHALADVEALEAGVPYAWLLRALHGYAGLLLLVATFAHVVESLWYRLERRLTPGVWWRSVLLVPVLLGALLGGFVLRGDADAVAAHQVWRGLLNDLPLAGGLLSRLLLGARQGDLGTVLAHHAGTFTVLLWVGAIEHGRRVWPDTVSMVIGTTAVLLLAAAVPLPLGPATPPAAGLLLGPWYLMGLQGALLWLPQVAAWILPGVALGALGAARHLDGRARRGALTVLGASLVAWTGFTFALLLVTKG